MLNVALQKNEFDLLVALIYDISRIHLDETKVNLVQSRLADLLEKYHFVNYMALYQEAKINEKLSTELIDRITTNETSFFRDSKVFESLLKHIFETYLDQSNRLQIWSAACATGQEPYTLAMMLKELIYNLSKFRLQIICTDISSDALRQAARGTYTAHEIHRGLDNKRITCYFDKQKDGLYKIKDELRSLVHFQNRNLITPNTLHNKFQIVLCRNVAIYFDTKTKQQIFENIANMMAPEGILIIGSSEMLIGISERFERREWNNIAYYQLKG
ncbi:MAG: chemotaxis protein CheR [Alteromonadaceae bacterium]|nr:MAG: chemotaxis protein CheR [Alteromonadaceae bacterium]